MARPSNTEERRRQIAAALMRTMATRGYAGASIASIAREAGLTAGLVHYHFDTKQEILLSLMRAIRLAGLARYEERRARAGTDPWLHLFAVTDAFLERDPTGGTATLQASWLVIASEAIHQPAVREEWSRLLLGLVRRIEKPLRAVLKREKRSTRNARSLATAIAAAIQGVYQMDAALPGAARPGTSAPALRHMIEGLVAGQPRCRARRGRG